MDLDLMMKNEKMYLMDGSFMCGITPYVDIHSVMKHPLWGSNLLQSNERAVINGHKDYIRGNYFYINNMSFYILMHKYLQRDQNF